MQEKNVPRNQQGSAPTNVPTRPCFIFIDGPIPMAQSIRPAGIGGSTRQTWPRPFIQREGKHYDD